MMKKNQLCRQRGYVALMSAIIISALLLAITVSLSMGNFWSGINILDSQSKEQSSALAQSCINQALLNIKKGIQYQGPVAVGSDSCNIISVSQNNPTGQETTIKAQGIKNKAYTNLLAIINSSNLAIVSWQECPSFAFCQ